MLQLVYPTKDTVEGYEKKIAIYYHRRAADGRNYKWGTKSW